MNKPVSDPIVIVGHAIRLPGGVNLALENSDTKPRRGDIIVEKIGIA